MAVEFRPTERFAMSASLCSLQGAAVEERDNIKNASFYVGMGLGFGLATKQVFEGCTVDPEGNILEELNTDKYFVAELTPRAGVELFRHFRVGIQLRIPTDGEVAVGPTISVTFGGGKKE